VVQRHDASSLHFDFRLEIDGVLISWAVPKGPSTDPRDKRLATRVEEDYVDFEGRIPEGDYGAGTVVVWDRGTYENLREEGVVDGPAHGHLTVWLDGEKIRGGYALTHARLRGDDRNWLLVKVDDAEADRRRKPARTQLESVLSGRTNEDL
jgi:DNA ligase D-like protein (predicted 3'-phosphoesterase)